MMPTKVRTGAWRTCLLCVAACLAVAGCGVPDPQPEPQSVSGTFTLHSYDYSGQVGGPCIGSHVFGNVNRHTNVSLETAQGEHVDATDLGQGTLLRGGNTLKCRYSFELQVTEGADDGEGFDVCVEALTEHRYTYQQLTSPGGFSLTFDPHGAAALRYSHDC